MARLEGMWTAARSALDAFASQWRTEPKGLASHRPCPACGGQMTYKASGWINRGNKYLRVCPGCGYADPRRVKLSKRI
jgi:predicted RNA-binding Zn-ribbon protein involved in translation (DUF1610 family)